MENGRSGIFKASDSAGVIRDVGICFFPDQKKKFLLVGYITPRVGLPKSELEWKLSGNSGKTLGWQIERRNKKKI